MVRSKLWAAQDALYALLQAEAGLARTQLTLGTPSDFQDENVWISGEVDNWTAIYAVTGLRAKDEQFTLRVGIVVQRLGNAYATPRDRAKELGQIVEDVIGANHTLSGTVELANITSARLEETMMDERRRAVGLSINVTCRAWLDA
jgi:hypothetical protein